jgi:hypothetical protein
MYGRVPTYGNHGSHFFESAVEQDLAAETESQKV